MPESVSDSTLDLNRDFNGFGEISSQEMKFNSNGLFSWNLDRDDNGRITRKTETLAGTSTVFDYTYDTMGRLLTVTKDGELVESYQYNTNGARISEINTLRGITQRDFQYSQEDHLLKAGSVEYIHDADGFLTRKIDGSQETAYTYSIRGELLNVTLPDGRIIEYVHDPLGRRIAKKINGQITEKYLWQGLTRLLAVYDGRNSLLMRFEYVDDRMPVTMAKNGVTYYLIYDQVESLRAVADASGNVVKKIDYDSFGNVIIDTAPGFEIPFGFAGGLYDRDIGLIRFGHRDYDPDTGRWTAKDPIFFAGLDTNLYGYVLNDPVNWVDPGGVYGLKIGNIVINWIIKKGKPILIKKITLLPAEQTGGNIGKDIFKELFGDGTTNNSPIQMEMDIDTDKDGLNDYLDPDDDNDGMPDLYDDDPKNMDFPDISEDIAPCY